MNDLERQDILRGKIMARLLEGGVRRQDLSSLDFVDNEQADQEVDGLFEDMIVWLRAEGYLRFDSFYGGTEGETCVALVSPTSLGMNLLEQKITGEMTGREIVKASSDGDASWWGKFGAFIGGFVGGASQSIS